MKQGFAKYFPVILLATTLLSACQNLPYDKASPVSLVGDWNNNLTTVSVDNIAPDWWNAFGSLQLHKLVITALRENPDLRIAAERIYQAELQVNIADASLWPAIGVSAQRSSNRSRTDGSQWQRSEISRIGFSAAYEIDFWGRLAAQRYAFSAELDATRFDYDTVLLGLVSGVASGWFNWLGIQERLATSQENIRIAERILNVVDARYRYGSATAADLARQRANLLVQESALLPLQLQAQQTRAAIAVLLGIPPHQLQLEQERLLEMALPEIATGIPSDLLTRRPDLASMEAQLEVANTNVAAARAALLPAFELGAGATRTSPARLAFTTPADSLSWSISLAQSLFDRGRRRNLVKVTQSQRVAQVEQYRKLILNAVQETDLAVAEVISLQKQEAAQATIVELSQRALDLTEVRYREGSDSLLTLLEAQRSLFQAQDQQVQMRQGTLNAMVDLYRVLGGGWGSSAE